MLYLPSYLYLNRHNNINNKYNYYLPNITWRVILKNIENFMKLLNKIFFISTIVWMAIIFIFSHQTGAISQDFSGGITEAIVKIIFKDFESLSHSEQINILETTNYIIRKGAHFTEYAILGMFTVLTLLTYICMDKTRYAKNRTKNMLLLNSIYALLISALYAVSDEIHQGFTADRSPAILDVAIDSSGALFGILFTITLFYFIFIKNILNQKETNIEKAELI